MSGAILENLDFLKLLLDTSKIQGECLLDTATSSQIAALSQICRNLKNLSLDQSIVEAIKRKKTLFKALSAKKGGLRRKGELISQHRKFICSILMSIKPVLVGLINYSSIQTPENEVSLIPETEINVTEKPEENVG